jgi:hypothetical protein
VHKLDTFTDENRAAQATVQERIWNLYRDLLPAVGNHTEDGDTFFG